MPNKARRDKHKYGAKSKPRHVAELVQRLPRPTAALREDWRETLRNGLGPELAPHVLQVLSKPRELVVFTESAAWCTRLRMASEALHALARARDASIEHVRVRILPAGAAS